MLPLPQPAIPLTLVLICHEPPPLEHGGRTMDFGAQDKARALHQGSPEPSGALRFALAAVARLAPDGNSVDFAGAFVHGVPRGRFLYLGYRPIGETIWARRWKVPLATITPAQVVAAQVSGQALQAYVTAKSGSTAWPLGMGWAVVGLHAPAQEQGPMA